MYKHYAQHNIDHALNNIDKSESLVSAHSIKNLAGRPLNIRQNRGDYKNGENNVAGLVSRTHPNPDD